MLFHPSLQNKLYFWDDERFIFLNPGYLNAHSWTEFWNFKSPYFKSWPFGYSLFWFFDKILKVENLFYYKFLNIVVHSINALLIFNFLKKCKFPFYLLLSLIFLAHPLNVENVSWIFQLLTLVAFTFFLLSFFFIAKYLNEQKKVFLLISFLFFMLSLFSKSVAVFAPIFFLIYFFLMGAGYKKMVLLIPFFIFAVLIGLINIKGTENMSQQNYSQASSIISKLQDNDWDIKKKFSPEQVALSEYFNFIYMRKKKLDKIGFNREEIFSQGVVHYFSKLILPVNQQFIYPVWKIPLAYSLPLIAIVFSIVVVAFKKTRDNKIILSVTYIAIFLLPYLGLTFITFFYWSNVSDRYTYFIIPAFVIILGLCFKNRESKFSSYTLTLYLAVLSVLTVNYGYKFNNPLALYEEIITYKKHPAIYSLLFEQYISRADLENGEAILLEARKKFPDDDLLKADLIRLEGLKLIYKKE